MILYLYTSQLFCFSVYLLLHFSVSLLLFFSAFLLLCVSVSWFLSLLFPFLCSSISTCLISPYLLFLSLCFPFLLLHISVSLFLSFHVCQSTKIWPKKSNNKIDEFTNLLIPFGNFLARATLPV